MMPVRGEAMQIADPEERERRLAKLTSQVLDEMVNEELIVQAADAAKVEVDSSEVQAALDEIKQQNSLDDAGLAQVLSQQGFTMANYRADLRRQLLRLRAVNQLVAPKVQITEEDVKARYDQMQRRSEAVSAVRLSHILIKLPEHPTEQQINEAKEKAAKAVVRVKGGEEFTKVAKPTSRRTTRHQGHRRRARLVRARQHERRLGDGRVLDGQGRGPRPGQWPATAEVFYVTDVKAARAEALRGDEGAAPRGSCAGARSTRQTQTWLEELRKKAYIDIKLQ